MRTVLTVIATALVLCACGTTSADRNLAAQGSAAPGSPVATTVLAPATVLPVAALCSTPVYATADGNFEPRFCGDGSINVVAWTRYATMSPRLLGAGREAGPDEVTAAIKADSAAHLTNVEVLDSYQLAAAYYGWSFTPNPACELLYQAASCY